MSFIISHIAQALVVAAAYPEHGFNTLLRLFLFLLFAVVLNFSRLVVVVS